MSVNSRLKATKIISHRKAFYMKRIPESSCDRKETVNIDTLVTSRNSDRKIMQSTRITSRPPSRLRKWNQLSQFWRTYTKVTPIEDISWPHFDDRRHKQATFSCIFVFVACLTISSSSKGHQPRRENSIPYMRALEIYRDREQPQEKETS